MGGLALSRSKSELTADDFWVDGGPRSKLLVVEGSMVLLKVRPSLVVTTVWAVVFAVSGGSSCRVT